MYYLFDDESHVTPDEMDKQFRRKWCEAYGVDEVVGAPEQCPECGRDVSNLVWMEPRKIRLTAGRYPDRISHWLNANLVLSENFKEEFNAAGLTGIEAFQPLEIVKVAGKRTAPPPAYYSAAVVRSKKVRVDPEKSIIQGRYHGMGCELCNPLHSTCNARYKTVLREMQSVEEPAYDIFQVYALGLVMSQRFYEFVQENQFTNFDLIPIDQYTWRTKLWGRPKIGF